MLSPGILKKHESVKAVKFHCDLENQAKDNITGGHQRNYREIALT